MPNGSPSVTFLFISSLSLSGIISPSSCHHLCSSCHYSTSIQLSLAWINFIIAISICFNTWICLDCFYHAGISLILTLLSCSTSIEPWDKSMLTPPTTNCSTWTSTYRLAPPPSYNLQWSGCVGTVGGIRVWCLWSSPSVDQGNLSGYLSLEM